MQEKTLKSTIIFTILKGNMTFQSRNLNLKLFL